MSTCSRREKSLLLSRSEPWSSSISVPMLSIQATENLTKLRDSETKRRSICRKSYCTHKLRTLTFKNTAITTSTLKPPKETTRTFKCFAPFPKQTVFPNSINLLLLVFQTQCFFFMRGNAFLNTIRTLQICHTNNKSYEGRSEINASYFIMLAHDVRGEYC